MNFDKTSFIAGIAVVVWFVFRAWRGARIARVKQPDRATPRPEIALDDTPDAPVDFGYKTSWLAVRTSDAPGLGAEIRISNLEPANWSTGVAAAYSGGVFLTPPVNGWVLVVSSALPELDTECRPTWAGFFSGLAAKYPDVCYFATHRVVDYSAWAKFAGGRLVRAFAYLGERGEVLVNEGAPTREELDLQHTFSKLPVGFLEADGEEGEIPEAPGEEDVLDIAEAWSVSTRELADSAPSPSTGWASRRWSIA